MKKHIDLNVRRFEPHGADPAVVAALIAQVRAGGDEAVRALTQRFDGVDVPVTRVPAQVAARALAELPADERAALEHAARNIRTFATAQRAALADFEVEVEPGVHIGQRVLPVARAACYVPGGRYPLPSTALMTAIPALVAGVGEVVVLSPPGPDGLPHRHVLAAAALAGAHEIHTMGGVQAVAAAALGTETLAPVDLIVGPGNAWVTEAKRQVFGQVGIDALAGPSEVLVLADSSADPERVAADMLAQAEHDTEAEAVALTDDPALAAAIEAALERQLADLPTAPTARAALRAHGVVAVVADREAMIDAANRRAPEHLHLHLRDAIGASHQCRAYGGLFIGETSAEVFGDYCSGSNHVLPTGGAAHFVGGLSVHTFVRLVTTQRLSEEGAAALMATTTRIARIEGLEGHARSAEQRGT